MTLYHSQQSTQSKQNWNEVEEKDGLIDLIDLFYYSDMV